MATIEDFLRNDRFAVENGCEIVLVERDKVIVRMVVAERHLNAGGVVQGGAIFTLADWAFAALANSCGCLTVSVSSNITFVRAVGGGTLYAHASLVQPHHRISLIEVRVVDDSDNLIAFMTTSGYNTQKPLGIDE